VVLTARKVNPEVGVTLGGGQYHYVATMADGQNFPGEHLGNLRLATCAGPFTLPAKSKQN
jgi:hypothetical protein